MFEMASAIEIENSAGTPVSTAAPAADPYARRTAGLRVENQRAFLYAGASLVSRSDQSRRFVGKPSAVHCAPLDRGLLQQALEAVATRHEILRATFANSEHFADRDGQPLQIANPNALLKLSFVDLSQTNDTDREGTAREVAKSQAQRPFDLTLGPLLRPVLVGFRGDDHLLLLNTHRIVADEASLDLFYAELWDCYQSLLTSEESRLPTVPLQFSDYADQQRELLDGSAVKEQIEYWKANLAGAPGLMDLATDKPRPAIQTTQGSTVSLIVERDLTEELRRLAQSERSNLLAVLIAGSKLPSRAHRQSDIVVGLSSENRDSGEARSADGAVGGRFGFAN